MDNLQELLQQRERLEAQIRETRLREQGEAIQKIKELIGMYDLAPADLFGLQRTKAPAQRVAPKYRNPETGETWTGRGKPPRWIQGQDREAFAIAS